MLNKTYKLKQNFYLKNLNLKQIKTINCTYIYVNFTNSPNYPRFYYETLFLFTSTNDVYLKTKWQTSLK